MIRSSLLMKFTVLLALASCGGGSSSDSDFQKRIKNAVNKFRAQCSALALSANEVSSDVNSGLRFLVDALSYSGETQ